MADGRRNNGGKRPGQGRPSKANEELIRRLGINAIIKVYGSVEKYYIFIAKESKTSFPHLKLLQEYVYGKPKETIDLNTNVEPEIDLSDLSDDELNLLNKIHGRNSNNSNPLTD